MLTCPAVAGARVTAAPRVAPAGRRTSRVVRVFQAKQDAGAEKIYKKVQDGNLDRDEALPLPPTTKNNVLPSEWRRNKKEKEECDLRATSCAMDDVVETFGRDEREGGREGGQGGSRVMQTRPLWV